MCALARWRVYTRVQGMCAPGAHGAASSGGAESPEVQSEGAGHRLVRQLPGVHIETAGQAWSLAMAWRQP